MSKVIKVSAMTAMSTMRLASLLFLSKSKPKLSADEAHQQGPGLTPKPFGEARMMRDRSRWRQPSSFRHVWVDVLLLKTN